MEGVRGSTAQITINRGLGSGNRGVVEEKEMKTLEPKQRGETEKQRVEKADGDLRREKQVERTRRRRKEKREIAKITETNCLVHEKSKTRSWPCKRMAGKGSDETPCKQMAAARKGSDETNEPLNSRAACKVV